MEALTQTTSDLLGQRLDTHFFAGSCLRNLTSKCPEGWEYNEGSDSCDMTGSYTGSCSESGLMLTKASTAQAKLQVSAKCRVEWPCQTCRLDFAMCPIGWGLDRRAPGKLVCKSISNYQGYCDRKVDFTGVADRDKAKWATRCGVQWNCKT